ncbi:unnamed protein product [Tuber aestivum]|uniref:C2H2-type domain-containing protein n=1 Tax=Tuber aestivum TaxID=59557 RepID=A0A292Q5H4_9PEZI|nr:unnamed protein product [Tuber aestivum]
MTLFRFGTGIYDWGVAFADGAGTLYALPPRSETLPLYLDDDGFYSVTGPTSYMNPTSHYLDNQPLNFFSSSSHLSCQPRQPFQLPIDNFGGLGIPLCSPLPPAPLSAPHSRTRNGPRRPSQRSYACSEPGCPWPSPFKTKQSLARHHEVKHLQGRLDCPVPGCKKVGDKGIKRKDNLRIHVWNQHRVKLPLESHLRYA